MKVTLFSLLMVAAIVAPSLAADTSEELAGKWSGNWKPQGGIPDAMTIELTKESAGRLTAKLLTPVPIEFTRASFDQKTRAITLEATDQKTGKHYKIDGKIVGMFGESGRDTKQLNWVHGLACPSDDVLFVADMNNWRVQKITLRKSVVGSR